jgi:uncharacterized membrane protein YoaK (UPF0700 family)
MLRHRGSARTMLHNLRLASLLSFVAGMVNVAGFISINRLTTNVTGHFAYLIYEVFELSWGNAGIFLLYIFFFFLGSFISNFLIAYYYKRAAGYAYALPVLVEASILIALGLAGQLLIVNNSNYLAYMLLFAMGMQNALVTSISNATVRTTHLTGLFTDLGIELSQLCFHPSTEQKHQLKSSIKLRLTIILFFFLGGIFGGLTYYSLHLKCLIVTGAILLTGLSFDYIKYYILTRKRAK